MDRSDQSSNSGCKAVLYIAVSLDGYIADRDGGVDWLKGDDESYDDYSGYEAFIKDVGTVLMGYTTYHQISEELSPDKWMYTGMTTYVFTHREMEDTDEIHFVNGSASELLKGLKAKGGKNIWICGGADLVRQVVDQDMIDRYHITLIPTILGDGVRLFDKAAGRIPLKLVHSQVENGLLDCVYERK